MPVTLLLSRALLVLTLFCSAPLHAALDLSKLQPQGYTSDFANVIGDAEEAQLNQYMGAVERSTGAQFAVVTIKSLEGELIDDVANRLYRQWGIGAKGKNEGLLLILAIDDRRNRIEVGYGLEPYITDGAAGGIRRGMGAALRERAYATAVMQAIQQLGQRVAEGKGVTIDTTLRPRRVRPQRELPWGLIAIVGVVLVFIVLSNLRGGGGGRGSRYYRSGQGRSGGMIPPIIFFPPMGGGGGGGYGGGGFGGYDSSGGFGGFGGGDSGGGGASGDW